MKCKDFKKIITKEFLQDKDVTQVYCIKVAKDMIIGNLSKQQLEDIIYTWCFYKGLIIVNYCKV